ncbi:MAG: hypothetical protein BWK80_29100 [Desulfobacteraceae bacterium IS3]|nr:MAG: hypothetical protein BWK80_29100 [Desulfobacteraceae bacterium IS3]
MSCIFHGSAAFVKTFNGKIEEKTVEIRKSYISGIIIALTARLKFRIFGEFWRINRNNSGYTARWHKLRF